MGKELGGKGSEPIGQRLESEEGQDALGRIVSLAAAAESASGDRCAGDSAARPPQYCLMCSEGDWTSCHRSVISEACAMC